MCLNFNQLWNLQSDDLKWLKQGWVVWRINNFAARFDIVPVQFKASEIEIENLQCDRYL